MLEYEILISLLAPYPAGHGCFVPLAAVGQIPSAYIWLKAPRATGIMANDVPTTLRRPVPVEVSWVSYFFQECFECKRGINTSLDWVQLQYLTKIIWSAIKVKPGNLDS